MIIHLPQPFSFFLPSALFPEGRDEDGKECDGFESAEEHGEADDEFAEIGECRVGTGGSELAEGRACVGHGGEGDSDGVHEGDSVHHHACGPECGEGHVDEEEGQHLEYRIPGEFFLSHGHVENRPWVHVELQNGGEAFEEKNEAHYLQPAGGGAGATTDKAQVEEQHAGEGAPQVVVTDRETGCGHHRGEVDRHMPQRVQPGHVAVAPFPAGQQQPAAQQDQEEAAYLFVAHKRPEVAAQGGNIEDEGQAAENHHHDGNPVHGWLLPFAEGGVRGGEVDGTPAVSALVACRL